MRISQWNTKWVTRKGATAVCCPLAIRLTNIKKTRIDIPSTIPINMDGMTVLKHASNIKRDPEPILRDIIIPGLILDSGIFIGTDTVTGIPVDDGVELKIAWSASGVQMNG